MRQNRLVTVIGAALAAAAACTDATGPSSGGSKAARLDAVAGDAQQGTVGAELADPLVVRVVDGKGKPVAGQVVNFVVVAGGGHVFAGTGVTDANGQARERWTLGTVAADSQKVEARAVDNATGAPLVFATFRATARPEAPAAVAAAGSAAFTGLPGLALPDSVAAVVRDRFGNPVPGAAVVWTVKQGGGAASPATSVAGPDGVARAQWTLGPQLDSTQVLDAAAGLSVATQFTANARIPADAALVKVSGDAQVDSVGRLLPQPLVVRVQRADGRPVAGIPVSFSVPVGAGSITPATAVSDADGRVGARWTLGTAPGAASATAAIGTGAAVGFAATAVPGSPASLQKVTGDGVTLSPGASVNLAVFVRDRFGNRAAGAAVAWSAPSGTLSPNPSLAGPDGLALTAFKAGAFGPLTVQASAPGAAPVTFSLNVSGVDLTIRSPGYSALVSDSLEVVADARAPIGETLLRVKAAVGDRVTSLSRSGTFDYVGRLTLAGLPPGAATLRVWAVASNGDSTEVAQPITYARAPQLSLTSPAEGAVARNGFVQIDATCTDCTAISAYATTLDLSNRRPVATGTNSLHAAVPLADGASVDIEVFAENRVDTRFLNVHAARHVWAESSPRWSEALSAGTSVLDVDGTRVLYLEGVVVRTMPLGVTGTRRLKVRPRGGGTETLLDTFPTGRELAAARLFPQGVIYMAEATPSAHVFEWRGGATADLGPANSWYSLLVAGSWAIWSNGNTLYRRDLLAGTTVTVSTRAGNEMNAVAENGDVAFWTTSYDVARFRAGKTDTLARGDNTTHNLDVVTDGVNALYRKEAPLQPGNPRIGRWAGGAETVVSAGLPFTPFSHTGYEANGGWSAWVKPDAGGVLQVWTIAPDGTARQATSGAGHARIAALGSSGDLVFVRQGRRYAVRPPYTAAPVDVGSEVGWMRFRGGTLEVLLGRSVFTVSY